MKTAKPIFIIKLNDFVSDDEYDFMKRELIPLKCDYHILLIKNATSGPLEFQCIYEKDFDEVKFNELKKIVEDSIKK